jgi:D-serine dehydratase
VLVEIGFAGGRTGVRNREDALNVAQAIAAAPGTALAGIECFEGLLPDRDAAADLVDEVVAVGRMVVDEGLLAEEAPMVLSAGGTSFFDRVGERLRPVEMARPLIRVLRSGCYLTHDAMGYAAAFRRIRKDTTLDLPPGGLEPALEIWAYVQSRPDPDKAILTMGKRDVGFDAGLPLPARWYRAGGSMATPQPVPGGHVVEALNDQHCHLTLPQGSPLKVGDMVGFGIGHPCTTFDKWSLLMIVDDQYRVTGAVRTFF